MRHLVGEPCPRTGRPRSPRRPGRRPGRRRRRPRMPGRPPPAAGRTRCRRGPPPAPRARPPAGRPRPGRDRGARGRGSLVMRDRLGQETPGVGQMAEAAGQPVTQAIRARAGGGAQRRPQVVGHLVEAGPPLRARLGPVLQAGRGFRRPAQVAFPDRRRPRRWPPAAPARRRARSPACATGRPARSRCASRLLSASRPTRSARAAASPSDAMALAASRSNPPTNTLSRRNTARSSSSSMSWLHAMTARSE